jgi:hypothetical protein
MFGQARLDDDLGHGEQEYGRNNECNAAGTVIQIASPLMRIGQRRNIGPYGATCPFWGGAGGN